MKFIHALTALLVLGASVSHSQAAVLVSYEFTGASAAQTSGDGSGTDVTFGAFTGQGGTGNVGISGSTNSIFVRWDATGVDGAGGDTLAEAISNASYATFTATNTTGSTIDLTNLTFDIFFNPYTTGVTTSVLVMTDLSGFTDGDQLGGITYVSGTAPGPSDTPDTITVDFSSLGNLAAGNFFEARLYFIDDSDSNDHIFRVNNVTVNYSAIPEPSAALLGGLGALLLLRRRRAKG